MVVAEPEGNFIKHKQMDLLLEDVDKTEED